MSFLGKFDASKAKELLIGVIGINITFVASGVLFEWMTKLPYDSVVSNQSQYFRSAVGLIAIERGVVWLLAEIYNHLTISAQDRVKMPSKNVAICGFIIFFSSITNTEAIYLVSFPMSIMVKSCNILSVILVGVLCSRVTDKQLKLGPKKIVVAIVVSIGIIMFRIFDPTVDFNDGKSTELLGLFLLFCSLMSDGFLPDFQAEIKQKYQPGPTEMMLEVNKWTFIFCLVYSIVINQFYYTLLFCWEHPLFPIHLIGMSVLTFFGQIFVYRLIKEFKQHIVPFVVTTRKVITVVFSLLYFHHESSFGQVFGILLVFCVTLYEFLSEMLKSQPKNQVVPGPEQPTTVLQEENNSDENIQTQISMSKNGDQKPMQRENIENS